MKIFNRSMGVYAIALFILFAVQSCKETTNTTLPQPQKLQVGVFNGNGASPVCVIETMEALKVDTGVAPREISAAEIMNGALNHLDVLVFPGGSGSKEYNNMGLLAAQKVKHFAQQKDKGLVGICAGGYLFSTTPGYPSLKIMPAPDIRNHYNRGRALIGFKVNKEGAKLFPELTKVDTAFYQYYDGPMYQIPKNSPIRVFASITTDITPKASDPKGVTPGKPAFFALNYGQGKVIASVGHPEATPGMRWIVPRMARWVANKPLVSYAKSIVKPEQYTHPVLYYPKTIANESKWFWQLFDKNADTVINALHQLHGIYSRPSIRWAKGLLRNPSAKVRLDAAKYLVETEYTDAIPDMETAWKYETDEGAKKQLGKLLKQLKSIVE